MTYAFLGLSLLFAAIGFVVTERNAKYLLAGYNTMSKAKQAAFDLRSYLVAFRKFHLFLGASLLILGLLITNFLGEQAGVYFLVGYPLLAYLLFGWYGGKAFAKERRPE